MNLRLTDCMRLFCDLAGRDRVCVCNWRNFKLQTPPVLSSESDPPVEFAKNSAASRDERGGGVKERVFEEERWG